MVRKTETIICIIFFVLSMAHAQTVIKETNDVSNMKPRLSLFTQKLLMDMTSPNFYNNIKFSQESNPKIIPQIIKGKKTLKNIKSYFNTGYLLTQTQSGIYAGALIKINNAGIETDLQTFGVKIGTKAGKIWSVKIPLLYLNSVTQLNGFDYIQVDEPVTKRLDSARAVVFADNVRRGVDLPKGYSGKNVIIGDVDGGFDYTNPSFLDTTGTINRLIKVWDQSLSGNPPAGFDYGREMSGDELNTQQTDTRYDSHGTHVMGIAGGSGLGTDGKFMGMAPGCDFVLVSYGDNSTDPFATGQSGILDGISYIFNYANSVNKPAVVNLSLGVHIGPHDGTSLFDQACDALTGPGKIIVGAGGNEGDLHLHLSHVFTSSDTTVSTVVESYYYGGVDIWGEPGNDFCFKLYYYYMNYDNSLTIVDSTDYFCTSDNINLTQKYVKDLNKNNHFFDVATSHSEYNNEPRASFDITNNNSGLNYVFLIKVRSTAGKINMWNFSDNIGYGFYGGEAGAIDGDTLSTVGEIGGTGNSIITTGAFTSKHDYTNLDGQFNQTSNPRGEIASFSSLGPTVDGRMKPDITAPGSIVFSAANSFDTYTVPGGDYWSDVVFETQYNSKYWYYAAYEGTSMSTPAVTGIIALWLEANPTLTPSQIRDILKNTPIKDNFTGNIGSEGSNTWGWGKINAWDGMKWVQTHMSVVDNNVLSENVIIEPNPNDGNFKVYLNAPVKDLFKLEIYNIYGEIIYNNDLYISDNIINLKSDVSGVYLARISTGKNYYFQKFLIIR